MDKKVGLWMDENKAIVVVLMEGKTETNVIISKAEKQLIRFDDATIQAGHKANNALVNDRRHNTYIGNLNIYYNAVIAPLRDADSILILGPGEVKNELKKRLQWDGLATRIAGIETVDKMTDQQVEKKVKRYFKNNSN